MKAIMYHYVRRPLPEMPNFGHLHVDDFCQQLDYFSKDHVFPTLQEFKEALASGRPIENSIILTFDDGFKDHYEFVFPELQRRGMWGFFFVPTMPYTRNRLLDVHRVHLLIGKFGGEKIYQSLQNLVTDDMLSHNNIKEFSERTYNVHANQKNNKYTVLAKRTLNYFISYQYREKVLDKLMEIFFPDDTGISGDFYMKPSELKEMADAGMVIGNHTISHPVLSKLDLAEQRNEIETSFEYFDNILGGYDLKSFCYPYGGFHSFSNATEQILSDCGTVCSFNVEARDIDANDLTSRPQALPRYNCNIFPFGSYRKEIET